ncbi:TPA: hypothetical protein L4S01_001537 [Pseudomonas aeruginosa]|nr:hypothetical protein [Pseudomonas aeruginosa]
MRNLISQAVDSQERTGVERLRETGRLGYQAVRVQAQDPGNNDALRRFGQSMSYLYGAYDRVNKSLADERSNEIIRKLTPEQRREATANGTLLYQDDPDAMEALRFKSGRNAAFEVESEIRQKIADGAFKTQADLAEYRNTRLEDKARSYAESVGIDSADQAYQRGFNSDIVQRTASIYDEHARKISEQTKAIAQMEATSDLGSMFSDEAFLRSPDAPSHFANYFSASLAGGSIPTEQMAVGVLQDSLAQNATQPGADVFFKNLGDQTVTLYGKQMKIRDIVGPQVLENYQAKAGEATFGRNRELTQQFTFGIQNAIAQSDPHEGLSMLGRMQSSLDKIQDTNMVTSQTQALNAARGHLLAKLGEDSAKRLKEMDKQAKADNRALVFESKYAQRLAGENVSTDWRTFETTPNTGEFKEEDAANFAIRKIAQVDSMSLSDDEKDKLKLGLLRADYSDGPFRKHFQTLTNDAVNQFNGLVTAESAEVNEENTARIREFQRVYKADPATIASLYPEQAALAERIDLMERNGIGLDTVIDADRRSKGIPREEQIIQERKWGELLTSTSSDAAFIPTNLRNAARTIYDSELYRTGDERGALDSVKSWLDKTTVGFTAADDKRVGRIQKRTLMVDPQDATSWRKGQDLVNEMIRQIAVNRPWINEGDITITETPNGIVLDDPLSSLNLPPITNAYLRQEYQFRQEEASLKAANEKQKEADAKIGKYKAEQERRRQSPFTGLEPSTGTLEGAAGFKDR